MNALIIILGVIFIIFGIIFAIAIDIDNLSVPVQGIIGLAIIIVGIGLLTTGITLEQSHRHTIYSSNEYDLDALYQEYVEKYGETGDNNIVCKIINDVEANSKETEYIDVMKKGVDGYCIEYHKFDPNHIADKYKKPIGE